VRADEPELASERFTDGLRRVLSTPKLKAIQTPRQAKKRRRGP